MLLRGTYYRFLQQFEHLLPDLARAAPAVVVGDLHVENYGTWRDRDGRLAWGINDLDEVDVLPYTVDLVRLATSALLAIRENHLAIGPEAACDAIHEGWRERIGRREAETFVLGERHGHLYKLASEAFADPAKFEHGLRRLPAWEAELPRGAARLLAEVVPWPGFSPALHTRVAGVGSLGSRRIVAVGELDGGVIVREAKQIPGPAGVWALPKHRATRGLADVVSKRPRRRRRPVAATERQVGAAQACPGRHPTRADEAPSQARRGGVPAQHGSRGGKRAPVRASSLQLGQDAAARTIAHERMDGCSTRLGRWRS